MTCETIIPMISPVKIGDSFTMACVYKQNDTPVNVSDFIIRSQIRDSLTVLVVELTVTKANQITNPGVFILSIAGVIDWPIDILFCDIQFSDSENIIRSTQTFLIPVVEDITHD